MRRLGRMRVKDAQSLLWIKFHVLAQTEISVGNMGKCHGIIMDLAAK